MKKLISLVLALMLALTAVSAFAEVISPDALTKFQLSGEDAETPTPGLTVEPVPEESKDLVNELVEGGNLINDLYEKTIFVGEPVDPNEGEWTCIAIVPMPAIEIDYEQFADAVGEIVAPVPATVAEYMLNSIKDVIALFSYKLGEDLFTSKVDFEIVKTDDASYEIIYKIPAEVLKAAEGCPSFMDIELVK